jgi:hypothetical protein
VSTNDPEGLGEQLVRLRRSMLELGEQLLAALAVEKELSRRLAGEAADPIAYEDWKICQAAIEHLAGEYLCVIVACRKARHYSD